MYESMLPDIICLVFDYHSSSVLHTLTSSSPAVKVTMAAILFSSIFVYNVTKDVRTAYIKYATSA